MGETSAEARAVAFGEGDVGAVGGVVEVEGGGFGLGFLVGHASNASASTYLRGGGFRVGVEEPALRFEFLEVVV